MRSRTVRRALRSLVSAAIIVVVLAFGAISASAEQPGEGVKDVDFTCTSVYVVTNGHDISHVELEFADGTAQRLEGENFGTEEVFTGIGEHDGDIITGVWVKAGNNTSDDADPGMGEHFTSDADGCDDDGDDGDDGDEDSNDEGNDDDGNGNGEEDGADDDGADGDDGDEGDEESVNVQHRDEDDSDPDGDTTGQDDGDGDAAADDSVADAGAAEPGAGDEAGSTGATDPTGSDSEVLSSGEVSGDGSDTDAAPGGAAASSDADADDVTAAAGAPGEQDTRSDALARTGLNSLQLVLLALVVAGLGSGLVTASRRRRQRV